MKLPIRRHDDDADREFEQLRQPFAEQLEHWPDFFRPLHSFVDATAPLADIEETDDSYLLDVELPGVRRADIDLQVDGGRLVLTAERHERARVGLLRHRTRTTGRLALSVTLPGAVDGDGVTATFRDGVLSVNVPKAAHERRRRIPVHHSR